MQPDPAVLEQRRTLAATLSNRHQQLTPLLEELQRTIRVFPSSGTVQAAEAIWASLGENWHLEEEEVRRDVIRFIQSSRTSAMVGSRSHSLPKVDVLVEACGIEHQAILVAPPVRIPKYLRSELESIHPISNETAFKAYRHVRDLARFENCKVRIDGIWEVFEKDWPNLPTYLQNFCILEFQRITSIVSWTNLAIDQGFLRQPTWHRPGRRMVRIDAAAQLLLPSSSMYEDAGRDIRALQLDNDRTIKKSLDRIVDRYSPQQAHCAQEWANILCGNISQELDGMGESSTATSDARRRRLKEIFDGMIRLSHSPPLSAFDLPLNLSDLLDRNDFSVFGPFLTRLRHSAQHRQGPVTTSVVSKIGL